MRTALLALSILLEGCADTRPHYHRGDDELVRLPEHLAAGGPVSKGAPVVLRDNDYPLLVPKPRTYQDAMYEALDQVHKLGLDGDLAMPSPAQRDPSDVVRYVYAQGWLACETRLACRDMADLIDQAINHPGEITDQLPSESLNRWTVRAVQQAVTYGVKSEPR